MKKIMMMLMCAATLTTGLRGVTWTNYAGGLLETSDNWDGAVGSSSVVTFAPPAETTMTVGTLTGFASGDVYVTSTLGRVTFDISEGMEWLVTGRYRQFTANFSANAEEWGLVTLTGGGRLRSTLDSRIGEYSNFNRLIVEEDDTVFASNGDIYLGMNSTIGNSIVITNGGTVSAGHAFHVGNGTSSGNSVRVTGTNAVLEYVTVLRNDSALLVVGDSGSNNHLIFEDGTKFIHTNSYTRAGNSDSDIYIGRNTGGDYNSLVVRDGAFFSNCVLNVNLRIGAAGSYNTFAVSNNATAILGIVQTGYNVGSKSNQILVTDGGKVTAQRFYLGGNTVGDTLLVDGPNSRLGSDALNNVGAIVNGALTVGSSSSYCTAIIANGALLKSPANFSVGSNSSNANHNTLRVTGGHLEALANNCHIGNYGSYNRLIFENGGTWTNGGNVVNATFYVGDRGDYNSLVVRGTGTLLTNESSLYMGQYGHYNELVVSNNAEMIIAILQTGRTGGGRSNSVYVTDGSKLSVTRIYLGSVTNGGGDRMLIDGSNTWVRVYSGHIVQVGNDAPNNTMVITNGALLTNGNNLEVGNGTATTGDGVFSNLLLVSGAQCVQTNAVTVGNYGRDNQLVVNDGGVLTMGTTLTVGSNTGADRNLLLIDRAALTNGTSATVGNRGDGNWLVITNDAQWTCKGQMIIGNYSSENEIRVTGGGKVLYSSVSHIYLAPSVNANGNKLVVTGTGSDLISTERVGIIMGNGVNSNNAVTVSDGGKIDVCSLTVGNGASSSNNVVRAENATLIAREGATVNNVGRLEVAGTNSVMTVGTTMTMSGNSTLHFEFGKTVPDYPLIDVGTTLTVTDPAPLKFDAKTLGLAGGKKDIVLVKTGTASGTALARLRDAGLDPTSTGIVSLRVSTDNTMLLCDVANEGATMILVR